MIAGGSSAGPRTQSPLYYQFERTQFRTNVSAMYSVQPSPINANTSQTIFIGAKSFNFTTANGHVYMLFVSPSWAGRSATWQSFKVRTSPRAPSPSNLVLKLEVVPSAGQGPQPLPTRALWTVDGMLSTGIYKGGSGQGVLDIAYHDPRKTTNYTPGTVRKGLAVLQFSGVVNMNPLPQLIHINPATD